MRAACTTEEFASLVADQIKDTDTAEGLERLVTILRQGACDALDAYIVARAGDLADSILGEEVL